MRGSYHVIVRLEAVPGRGDELLNALRDLARASLTTPMCTGFEVTRSIEDGSHWLLESFGSEADYHEHVTTSHARYFLEHTLVELVVDRDVTILAPV